MRRQIPYQSERGGGTEIEVLKPENLPKFVYQLVDGVLLTDKQTFQITVQYLVNRGIEWRKIILWSNSVKIESFNVKENNGTAIFFVEGLQFHVRNQEDFSFLNRIQTQLAAQKQFYALNPSQYKTMIERQYRRPINWENPKTFTEKIQWMKLYDSTPIKTRLADKYLVRQWVAEKIGAEYLIPLLGVWDNFDDIDFDLLPNQFVLKCNHGSGMNIIVRDKNSFDKENAREKINAWLNCDFGTLLYELHYNNIKKKIIAEKFMSENNLPDINNYKFWCYNGKTYCCGYESGRLPDGSIAELCIDFFDMNWNHLNIERADHPNSEHPEKFSKPKTFKVMKKLAAELCKGFPFVRVDFYEVAGKIYFGEMTFTPAAGLFRYKPDSTDEELGKLITLPSPTEFKQLSQ